MAVWLMILAAILLLLAICITAFCVAPKFWGGAGGANLLGEEMIADADAACRFADAMVEEACQIWSQESGWHVALKNDVLHVESIRIDHGPFANSGVYLTRATAKIANAAAERVFSLMTSVEGFAIIDPLSDPADFASVNERYGSWQGKDARLEVAPARAPMKREFCVLNAIDPDKQMFCSKSVQHASMPGSSSKANGGPPPNGNVRALNTFALRTRNDGGNTMIDLINFADLGISPALMNWINVKGFIPGIIQRLEKRLAEEDTSATRGNDLSQPLQLAAH